MRLELYEEDLLLSSKDNSTSSIGFEDLTPEAQQAVLVVGKGTFYRRRGTNAENYNVVYPVAVKTE